MLLISGYAIDHAYTVSATIQCDVNQVAPNSNLPGMIFGISDQVGSYICWIGVYKGYLNICSYSTTSYGSGHAEEYQELGFLSTSIMEYNNQPMNIQVVGEEGGNTKLYINGNLKKTFESGNLKNPTFKNLTVGDLRLGRNLKFVGKLYDFAIYDSALSEDDVKANWNFFKR